MGYLGNEPTTGHFPVQTNLVGPGPTYTLDRAPASAGAIEVSVAGVLQPTTSYSVSGTTLTMAGVASSIPIFIRYLGETLTLPTIADGVVVEDKIGAGAVTLSKIGADAVDGTKIADNAINSEHYTDGSIDNIHTNFQPGTTFKGDGSSARGKITLNCEMNTHGVSIQSPAHSSAASYTLTLPPNDGAANEFLKTDGSGVLSFAAAGGGGTWTESSSGTFGGANIANFTGITGTTKILITNYEKSTSSAVRMRTSSDGGSSFDSGSNTYSSSLYGIKGSSSSLYTDVRSNSVTSVQIDGADSAGGTNAADDVSFEIIIWNPADATKRTMFTWEYWASMNSSAYTDRCTGVAHRSTTAIVNAFQIHGSGGTISGSYKIYTLN